MSEMRLRRVVLYDVLGERFATAVVRLLGQAELQAANRAARGHVGDDQALLAWQRELVRRCTVRVRLERRVSDARVRAGLRALAAGQILQLLSGQPNRRFLLPSTNARRQRQWRRARDLCTLTRQRSVSVASGRRGRRSRGRRPARLAGRRARAPASSSDSDDDEPARAALTASQARIGAPSASDTLRSRLTRPAEGMARR